MTMTMTMWLVFRFWIPFQDVDTIYSLYGFNILTDTRFMIRRIFWFSEEELIKEYTEGIKDTDKKKLHRGMSTLSDGKSAALEKQESVTDKKKKKKGKKVCDVLMIIV